MGANLRTANFWLVVLLFVLSGLSSLIYQVIWTRLLVFVFGSTSFATATVLAVFMGGLALGSFIAGRVADRVKNPFLLYGILEGVIGLFALLAPSLFDSFVPVYQLLWQSMHLSVLPFSLVRFAVVAGILLLPTACMGATLPLLSKFVTTSVNEVGERVGILYSMNTLGAVVGTLLAGFLLIPSLGLWSTTVVAASINFVLFLVVLLLSGKWRMAEAPADANLTGATPGKLPLEVVVVLSTFALSGAVAMIYEVAWTRSLLMIVGSTTYAFSIMLSTFLVGIFLGGLAMARVADKVKSPLTWFGYLQVFLCLGGLLSLWLFNFLPYWNIAANTFWREVPSVGMLVRFLLSGLVLLPITFCLGAIFPFAVKSCARSLELLGRSVGTLYSANTLGAICGAFIGGFAIIPFVGTEQTLILCAVTNLALGIAILTKFSEMRTGVKVFACAALAIVFAWAGTAPKVWDPVSILLSQSTRRSSMSANGVGLPSYGDWIAKLHNLRQAEFWKDGLCAHVAILRNLDSGHLSLLTNGHVDASDWHDMPTQQLLPVFPQLFRARSQDVAIIGWGSGVTVGYALLFPIKRVVCAEIEPEVINAARFFNKVNLNPENDKRLFIEPNDGRNYLLATKENFDVIVSEPSNPWQSGVCNLFTKEYFQLCHARLKPGGVFSLWCQAGEVSAENITRVLKALRQVFRQVMVFSINGVDTCVVASDEPLKLNLKAIDESFQAQPLKAGMESAGILSANDIAARIYMVPSAVDQVVAGAQANTDDMNYMEYDVAKTYEQKNFVRENRLWFLEHGGPLWDAIDWTGYSRHDKAFALANIAGRCLPVSFGRAIRWAEESCSLEPNCPGLITAGLAYSLSGKHEQAIKVLDAAVKLEPGNSKALEARGLVRLRAGQNRLAALDFETLLKKQPENLLVRYRLAEAFSPVNGEERKLSDDALYAVDYSIDQNNDAKKVLEVLLHVTGEPDFVKAHPTVLLLVGESLAKAGRQDEAIYYLEQYLLREGRDPFGWRILGNVYANKGDNKRAAVHWEQSLKLGDQAAEAPLSVAEQLVAEHKDAEALVVLNKVRELAPSNAKMRVLMIRLASRNAKAMSVLEDMGRASAADAQAVRMLKSGNLK